MDRLFETQKKTEVVTSKEDAKEEKHEKLQLHLRTAEEKTFQFEEQTFSVDENMKEIPQTESVKNVEDKQDGQRSSYLQSFENKTVADIMREDAERQSAQMRVLEKQKESLSEDALDPNMTIELFQKSAKEKQTEKVTELEKISQPQKEKNIQEKTLESTQEISNTQENISIIEKPNYDLLQEPKKIKLSKKSERKKKKLSSKTAGILLACALAGSAVICVGNAVLIDQMSASFVQIDETYKLNLAKYLKSIYKLDTTKKSMEFLETYPDDVLNAGELGEKSNWFDRLCNFLGGLFGG